MGSDPCYNCKLLFREELRGKQSKGSNKIELNEGNLLR